MEKSFLGPKALNGGLRRPRFRGGGPFDSVKGGVRGAQRSDFFGRRHTALGFLLVPSQEGSSHSSVLLGRPSSPPATIAARLRLDHRLPAGSRPLANTRSPDHCCDRDPRPLPDVVVVAIPSIDHRGSHRRRSIARPSFPKEDPVSLTSRQPLVAAPAHDTFRCYLAPTRQMVVLRSRPQTNIPVDSHRRPWTNTYRSRNPFFGDARCLRLP